jgi:hypothetical protein
VQLIQWIWTRRRPLMRKTGVVLMKRTGNEPRRKGRREILISPNQIARHHYWSFSIQRRFEIVFKYCLQMSGNELYVDDVWLVNYWHFATSVAMMAKEKEVHCGSRISFSFANDNCIYFGYLLLSLVS